MLVMNLVFSSGESVKDSVNTLKDSDEQIILALIAIIGTSVAALVYTIRNNSIVKNSSNTVDRVNEAVNNIGPGEHRLWDKIDRIEKSVVSLESDQDDFDSHGWENLPPDLNNAVSLTTTIRDLQNHHAALNEKLDDILDEIRSVKVEVNLVKGELRDHVDWEMRIKYSEAP